MVTSEVRDLNSTGAAHEGHGASSRAICCFSRGQQLSESPKTNEPEFCQNSQPPSTLLQNSESSGTITGQHTDSHSRAEYTSHDNVPPVRIFAGGVRIFRRARQNLSQGASRRTSNQPRDEPLRQDAPCITGTKDDQRQVDRIIRS